MRTLAAVAAAFLLAAAPASAAPGGALLHAAHALTAPTAACPPGTPVQPITVVNQARVSRLALARVEAAVTAQSLQLRATWGTPCVQFGPGGWPLYLRIGGGAPHGEHNFHGQPYGLIWTAGTVAQGWSRVFSHELVEMLEDPALDARYFHDGSTWQREIADPVEGLGYRVRGVYVSDFVTPAWYAGASTGADLLCQGAACADDGPPIAPADAPGPYDQMRVLTQPWS